MRCAELDSQVVIAAHAHAQLHQLMSAGNFPQEREMRARMLFGRWDTHKTDDRQFQLITTASDKSVRLLWPDTRLLWLLTGIDLDIELLGTRLLGDFLRECNRQFFPIEGLDHVKKRHGFFDLVGLQRADQVQFEWPISRLQILQGWIFVRCFLDAVLTKDQLTGSNCPGNSLSGMRLGNRNEIDLAWIALPSKRLLSDTAADVLKIIGDGHDDLTRAGSF